MVGDFDFGFDGDLIGDAFSKPGADTRQWLAVGIVMRETPGEPSVDFDSIADLGPLVNVKLQQSGYEVSCRVMGGVAGNGEGEWFPFLEGDEVLVAVPEGDEHSGCIIMGRLNNGIDKWPASIAGTDTTKNNFGFRRMRTPYIIETASSYLIRSAVTQAYFGIMANGGITLANSDRATLQLSPDTIGFRMNDGNTRCEINVSEKSLAMTAENNIDILAAGVIKLAASGANPAWHLISTESVLVIMQAVLQAIGAVMPGQMYGSVIAGASTAIMNAAIAAAAALPIDSMSGALLGALATPSDITGHKPGVGSAGIMMG